MKKLLSLKETSEILCVSEQTLRNWDNSGKLKAVRTEGGQRRYNCGDVYRTKRKQDNQWLFKQIDGEKWYIREFDFRPEAVSDRNHWITDIDVIKAFKNKRFKWFTTYDECVKECLKLRKMYGILEDSDDNDGFQTHKNNLRDLGYFVD